MLYEILATEKEENRLIMLNALGQIGSTDTISFFERIVASSDSSAVRIKAVSMISRVGGDEAVEALRNALDVEQEGPVRNEISKHLTKLTGERI